MRGDPRLLNERGFRCCLGFCASQLGVPDPAMLEMGTPADVGKDVGPLTFRRGDPDDDFASWGDTELTTGAVEINDDPTLSDLERESGLESLFEKHGHTIEFTGGGQ